MKQSIVQLGGLGNQMFIYSLYYALKKNGAPVQIDASAYNLVQMHNGYELPSVFGIDPPEVCKKGMHAQWVRLLLHYKPKMFVYDEPQERTFEVFNTNKPYITGYWQSDMYFNACHDDLIRIFSFKSISERNIDISKEMQSVNSVSLHIRRGDYLNIPGAISVCTEEYYRNAIAIINESTIKPYFYIFSNDPAWSCNFAKKLDISYTIIDHNTGENSYEDMFLMSQCKHNILANSSFSWWGAYLNTHNNPIRIAPKLWCKGHTESTLKSDTPSNWIRI